MFSLLLAGQINLTQTVDISSTKITSFAGIGALGLSALAYAALNTLYTIETIQANNFKCNGERWSGIESAKEIFLKNYKNRRDKIVFPLFGVGILLYAISAGMGRYYNLSK